MDDDKQPQADAVDDTKIEQDADMAADDVQEDDTDPTLERSKWFKEDVVVRPETPDPEWHKEPNDVPEQCWFNDMVNSQKGPVTFDDIIEGQRIPYDLGNPLPFHGPPGRTIIPLNKNDGKYLMRIDELHKFSDGTLMPVRDILHSRLQNFVLGYNAGMPSRAWTETDREKTATMVEEIEKTLLKRRITRSLKCFVGGRSIETDYRLLTRT
ncbi:hypothetical protein Tco_1202241 [Tanacetum coccineum]